MNGQALNPRVQMAELLLQCARGGLKQLVAWSLLLRRPWIQLFLETLIQLLPLRLRTRLTEQGNLEPWVNRTFARKQRISARQMEDVKACGRFPPALGTLRKQLLRSRRYDLRATLTYRASISLSGSNAGRVSDNYPARSATSARKRRFLMQEPLRIPATHNIVTKDKD